MDSGEKKHFSVDLVKKETYDNEIRYFLSLNWDQKRIWAYKKIPVHTVPKEYLSLQVHCNLDQLSSWVSLTLHADHQHIPWLSSTWRGASRLWSLEPHMPQRAICVYARSCLCELAFYTESKSKLESRLWTWVDSIEAHTTCSVGTLPILHLN